MIRSLMLSILWVSLSACYAHTRRDAPAKPPERADMEMVHIEGGVFMMGDINGEPQEYPERRVELASFAIDRMEVSQGAYAECVRAKACEPSAYPAEADTPAMREPVVGVSWNDAVAYCRWLGKRLPTEAEWEFAAKAAGNNKWPWTGPFKPEFANAVGKEDGYEGLAPVDSFEAGKSPFGVLNMAGNADEWVSDYFDPNLYREDKTAVNPKGPASGRERVVRGGSFRDPAYLTRAASRRAKLPTEVDNTVGFRCAKSL